MTGTPALRAARSSPPAPGHLRTNRWAVLGVLCVSLLVVALDNTILNVALPTLVRDLGATSSQLQWIVDAYALVFAGLLLVGGSIGDRFGRKPVFLAGLVLFAAGSTASAFSGSVDVLVASRAGMGVGGALIMPSTLSIITATFSDPTARARAIGAWSATTGLGIALGPLIGGVLLAHFWWGSVFLVNVPIALAGFAVAAWIVPNSKDDAASPADPAGALLSVAGLGLLLWAIIQAPAYGWSSASVIGGGIAGLGLLAGFATWERHSPHPMLRLDFFRKPRFAAATASLGLVMFSLFGALFMLTQLLQFALGFTPVEAGLRILPVAALLAAAAPLAGMAVRRVGSKAPATLGLLVIAAGLWQLSGTPTGHPSFARVLPGMLLLGLGAGLAIPPAVDSVMGSVPVRLAGVGAATNGVSLQTGGALGVAVLGSLLSGHYQDHMRLALAGRAVPPAALHAILGSVGAAVDVARQAGGATGAALAEVARASFVNGMDLAMAVGALVALASAAVAAFLLPSREGRAPRSG